MPAVVPVGFDLGYNVVKTKLATRLLSLVVNVFNFHEVNITMDVMDTIKNQIEENAIILYMKGSPNAPQCGFSMKASQALMACGRRFAYVDVLSNPDIRQNLPVYANWPTFPQLWVKGELVGGCDIILEMHEKGELKPLVEDAAPEEESEG